MLPPCPFILSLNSYNFCSKEQVNHVSTLSLHPLFELRPFLLNGTGFFSYNPWTEEFTTGHNPLFSTSMGFFLTHARSPIPVGSYFTEINLRIKIQSKSFLFFEVKSLIWLMHKSIYFYLIHLFKDGQKYAWTNILF